MCFRLMKSLNRGLSKKRKINAQRKNLTAASLPLNKLSPNNSALKNHYAGGQASPSKTMV